MKSEAEGVKGKGMACGVRGEKKRNIYPSSPPVVSGDPSERAKMDSQ